MAGRSPKPLGFSKTVGVPSPAVRRGMASPSDLGGRPRAAVARRVLADADGGAVSTAAAAGDWRTVFLATATAPA